MDRWGKIKINQDDLFIKAIQKSGEYILELNKKQLSQGIDATGKRLSSYSPRHIRARRKKGLQTAVKDLNFDGGHYAGFYFKPDSTGVEIASTDWKSSILENWGEIYGLTEENVENFLVVFGEVYLEELKSAIRV